VPYNFQTESNKIKLLTEYESVIQKVLWLTEVILQNAPFVAREQFYFVVSCLKTVGHGNLDNNLESLRILTLS
jgi:hypothetical protein